MAETTTPAPLGLRERKRRETRIAISRAATRLFLRDGFHNVSVGEVAKAADVSKVTVFNYFPTKEDLALAPMAEHTRDEVRAVRERPAGTSPLDALRDAFLHDLAAHAPQAGMFEPAAPLVRMILTTPALSARLLAVEADREQALADALSEETGERGAFEARVFAAAALGVRRTLIAENYRRLAEGTSPSSLYPDALARAERAFGLLESGFGGAFPVR
ncbi:TetR family transcriptional regulator [Streptomyces sp. A0642]|uniref:TetR/AcrR family transcriptional regulator n=1 Tax=Streptomyces sp. A0642 TaxID=2563100 RepID=UPI0010A2335F|nr:TetR/AcrR family transcriptional regulator [Streptomyces sp. A0642]THA74652.1 TetR family transcriptional regulator [Streptomyces sp. A0642]